MLLRGIIRAKIGFGIQRELQHTGTNKSTDPKSVETRKIGTNRGKMTDDTTSENQGVSCHTSAIMVPQLPAVTGTLPLAFGR